MPSISVRQRHFMGAELARLRARKKTKTEMSERQLRDFASTDEKGLLTKALKNRKAGKK